MLKPLTILAAFALIPLAACEEDTPAEEAAENVEETFDPETPLEEAGEAVDEAAEDTEEAIDEAVNDTEEAIDEVTE